MLVYDHNIVDIIFYDPSIAKDVMVSDHSVGDGILVDDNSMLDRMLAYGHSMLDGGIGNGWNALNSILMYNIEDNMVVHDHIFPHTSYGQTKQDTSCYRT